MDQKLLLESSKSNQEQWEESIPAPKSSHIIFVPESRWSNLADTMRLKMLGTQPLSHGSTGETSCCIFRLPKEKVGLNSWYYYPEIISIGPYHHGEEKLREAEENKWRYFKSLFSRYGDGRLESCIKDISGMEKKIRDSYQDELPFESEKLVKMMVLDGFFIIEFLLRVHTGEVNSNPNDSVLGNRWKLVILMRDLIKVENQIPFFVLESIFNLLNVKSDGSLPTLVLHFFSKAFGIGKYADMNMETHPLPSISHILDILRSSLLPTAVHRRSLLEKSSMSTLVRRPKRNTKVLDSLCSCFVSTDEEQRRMYTVPKKIHSASVLHKKGVKIRAGACLGLSTIKFREGVLWIPCLVLDDFTCSALLNCIAYEQCYTGLHYGHMHITGFAAILDSLINTAEDVRLLRDSNVIEHFYGTDEEVAQFCNNLGKAFPLDPGMDHLWGVFEDINSYCRNPRNRHWVSFKQTYLRTPWIFFSALAAVILLLLTMAQTLLSSFSYFFHKS